MPNITSSHRPGRPAPIRNAAQAMDLIDAVVHHPLEPEIIGFLLDDGGRGNHILVVKDAGDPDCVFAVAECLAAVGERVPPLGRLVLASVRPIGGLLSGDVERWWELNDIADVHGIELIDWFVLGESGIDSVRLLTPEPSRW